jgi:hypothetical protein
MATENDRKAFDGRADFCLEVTFEKGHGDASRVFRALAELIEACQRVDSDLIQAVDARIRPILLLEDVDAGSVRTWLKTMLETVDDEALRDLDWRRVIGRYLVKVKYFLIDFIGSHTTVSNKEEIAELKQRVFEAAQETGLQDIPIYQPVPDADLIQHLSRLAQATKALDEGDTVRYVAPGMEASFNLSFSVSPEAIEDLLTRETITSRQEMILKVRKPDYLGEAMWEFRFAGKSLSAKIDDKQWLRSFHARKIDVRPGDALRVNAEVEVRYDHAGDVLGVRHTILQVLEVITQDDAGQPRLLPPTA